MVFFHLTKKGSFLFAPQSADVLSTTCQVFESIDSVPQVCRLSSPNFSLCIYIKLPSSSTKLHFIFCSQKPCNPNMSTYLFFNGRMQAAIRMCQLLELAPN